ncbi:MAG TPA: SpoIIE family protein phosphatase [Alphaproteobacteria bacterium]|nr:SpoIIE family protein phosphatase [Alphaproteobacteria bacterium]
MASEHGGHGGSRSAPPWRRSLLTRVNLALAGATLAVGLLAAALGGEVVGDQQRTALARHAELLASVEAGALANAVYEFDARATAEIARALMAQDPAVLRIAVWTDPAQKGEPLIALGEAPPAGALEINRPIVHADAGGPREIGALRLAYATDEADRMTRAALMPLLATVLLSLVTVVLLISGLLHKVVLAPLARLTHSAAQIAAGDYAVRLTDDRPDEIGQLARTFVGMAGTVANHTATLEQRVAERTEALHRSNETLADANRKIMDSLEYARMIQRAILPRPDGISPALQEFFVLWQPRDVVGGDFYFFRQIGGRFLIGIIDCSGHGVPGAFMTMAAKAVLDRVVGDGGDADPAAMLQAVNRIMRATLHRGDHGRGFDNGLDIGLCLCDPAEGRLVFAGARISLFCVDADATAELRGDPHSLGYQRSRDDFRFRNHEVALTPGRRFYMTTDGFLDQAGGQKGFGFGTKRFVAMLEAHRALPLPAQRDAFEACLNAYQADWPQRDDITLLGFAVAGTAA